MAGLDKKAFITGPCLWLKVLQDTIYSLGVFSSWSSPPPPPLPHQKVGECSRTRVPVAATCSFHTQLRMAPWDSTSALFVAQMGCACIGQRGVSLFVTSTSAHPLRKAPERCWVSLLLPQVTFLPWNLQETKRGTGTSSQLFRFSIKLQLSQFAFVVVLFFR